MRRLPRIRHLIPLITYERGIRLIQLITAAGLFVYALSALHRGEAGIVGYAARVWGIQPSTWEIAFTFCSAFILARRCSPVAFSILTMPLALYALAGIPLFIDNPKVAFSGIAGHLCFWMTTNVVIWIEAANGRG